MAEKVISVGDEVDSWCTRCKLMLAHNVSAMVDEKIEKVVCKTCGGKHKYRPQIPKSRQKKAASGKKTTKKRTRTRRTKDPAVKWEEALSEKDTSSPREYAMSKAFGEDDVIDHEQFGVGLVTEVRDEGKMEVIFKDGTKLLVHDREKKK